MACELKSGDCGVCPHHFTCECADWVSQKLPCKRIHLLCIVEPDVLRAPPALLALRCEEADSPAHILLRRPSLAATRLRLMGTIYPPSEAMRDASVRACVAQPRPVRCGDRSDEPRRLDSL